jgi:hypothetical protein
MFDSYTLNSFKTKYRQQSRDMGKLRATAQDNIDQLQEEKTGKNIISSVVTH